MINISIYGLILFWAYSSTWSGEPQRHCTQMFQAERTSNKWQHAWKWRSNDGQFAKHRYNDLEIFGKIAIYIYCRYMYSTMYLYGSSDIHTHALSYFLCSLYTRYFGTCGPMIHKSQWQWLMAHPSLNQQVDSKSGNEWRWAIQNKPPQALPMEWWSAIMASY